MESSEFEILEMLKNIKLMAFDMDGVLRIGNNIIEGSENIFNNIKSINKKKNIGSKSLPTGGCPNQQPGRLHLCPNLHGCTRSRGCWNGHRCLKHSLPNRHEAVADAVEPGRGAAGVAPARILCLLVRGRHQQHTDRFRPEAAPAPTHRLKLVCRRVRGIIVGDLLGGNRPFGVVNVVHGHVV
jgi:hypothetical protein